MLEVQIKGLEQLEQALAELPIKLERNIVRGMLRAAGKVIELEAKAQAPVKSGRLRDSIKVRTGMRYGKPTAQVRAGGTAKGAPFYAHFVEFGTGSHQIKPRRRKSLVLAGLLREVVDHPGGSPHPFMRPAMDAAATRAATAAADYARMRLTKEGIDLPDPTPDDLDQD